MKKLVSLLLCMALVCSFAACSDSDPALDTSGTSQPPANASDPLSEPSTESADPPTESVGLAQDVDAMEPEKGVTLIAYFSWSGNTEQMAKMIQAETGGELFEITPATPYTDDYDTLLDVAQQEQAEDARPELTNRVENWDSYAVVFVGYPSWWGDAPMLIYSFLESYDWEGKTLIPFCTSGGSAFGRSLNKLSDSASGATILEGLHVPGSRVEAAREDISAWIDGLNLTQF